MRVSVIDGLGHGPDAETAGRAAADALRAAPELGPVEALLTCDRALRGTRGAGASVLCLDSINAIARFAGVGNVEGRILTATDERRFSPDRGVLGRGIRSPHLIELPLGTAWTVLMHSDGISSRFVWAETASEDDLDSLASLVLTKWGRPTDDATVVIVRDEAA